MIRYSKNFLPATLCALVMTGCTLFPVPETPRAMDFAPAPLALGRAGDQQPYSLRVDTPAALRRSQGFERVIADASPAEADLTMVTQLLAFHSQPGANHSDVVIRLYSEIMENRSRRTACLRVFDIKTSAASHRLDDVIIAFDGAGQRLMNALVLWASACQGPAADPKAENK
jgi:cholesterol transport system auxiliary component